MIQELDRVVLVCDLSEQGLCAGDIGTVVLMHGKKGFEVEFATLDGETLVVLSLTADQVRAVASREIAHARKVSLAS